MNRAPGPSVRLDIIGLEPRLFELCRKINQTVLQSRGKDRLVSTESTNLEEPNPELASVPKEELAIYNKIVSITIDFERAYGRSVIVRVFEKSSNKIMNSFLKVRDPTGPTRPTFYVNGVKVYSGIPNSFSELDEAIDNSFGRKDRRF